VLEAISCALLRLVVAGAVASVIAEPATLKQLVFFFVLLEQNEKSLVISADSIDKFGCLPTGS
jgi:hypothetical protein